MGATDNEFVCKTDFETSDVVLGFLLTIGIIISFLPQIIVMIVRKNVDGLSVIMCWLNYANCMGTFVNSLFLNWFVFECCSWMNPWTCFRNLLAVIQLFSPFICSFVIFVLYVIYRPRLTKDQINENSKIVPENPPIKYSEQSAEPSLLKDSSIDEQNNNINNNNTDIIGNIDINSDNNNNELNKSNISISLNSEESSPPQNSFEQQQTKQRNSNISNAVIINESNAENNVVERKEIIKPKNRVDEFIIRMDWYSQPLFWGSILLSIVMFGVGVGLVYRYGSESKVLQIYAFSCGIFALVLVFLQWIPQIYTTIIANEIGSLSLVSVCIQAPGAFLVMFFQIDSKQNWSTWVPYLATGVQMIVLIVICVYYLIRDRKKNKALKEQKAKGQIQESESSQPETYQNTDKTI